MLNIHDGLYSISKAIKVGVFQKFISPSPAVEYLYVMIQDAICETSFASLRENALSRFRESHKGQVHVFEHSSFHLSSCRCALANRVLLEYRCVSATRFSFHLSLRVSQSCPACLSLRFRHSFFLCTFRCVSAYSTYPQR